MAPKRRICFVLPAIPAHDGSNDQRVGSGKKRLFEQAQHFARMGHEVHVFTESLYAGTIPNLTVHTFLTPDFYRRKQFWGTILRVLHLPLFFLQVFFTMWRIRPSVVHVILGSSWIVFLALLTGRLIRGRTIAEATLVGASDAKSVTEGRAGFVRLMILKTVDTIVNISPLLRGRCLEVASVRQCVVIANPIDTTKFAPIEPGTKKALRKKLGVDSFAQVFLCVAIIRPRKGQREVLDIFERINDEEENSCMVFVGATDKDAETKAYFSELKSMVRTRNLDTRVLFTGAVSNVSEWMQASDIFLFASTREGLGNVVLESMSSGVPVVMKNISEVSDFMITNGKDGFIFESADDAVSVIKKLIADKDVYKRVSRAARETIAARFDSTIIMRQYKQLYGMD